VFPRSYVHKNISGTYGGAGQLAMQAARQITAITCRLRCSRRAWLFVFVRLWPYSSLFLVPGACGSGQAGFHGDFIQLPICAHHYPLIREIFVG
jgi:hypothetical protein